MATRTISIAGGNYNAVGAWDEGIVPTIADDVVCRGGGDSGNLTVNVGSLNALSLNFTNYSGTFTVNEVFNVGGNITLSSTMTIVTAGARDLRTSANCTFTSNGKAWTGNLWLGYSGGTVTLADDLHCTGTYGYKSGTMNGNKFYVSGNGQFGQGGTTVIEMNGTGSLVFNTLSNSLIINTAGTITFTVATHYFNSATLTYTSGTVVTTGSTLASNDGGTTILNTAGITFNIVTANNGSIFQLNSLLTATTIQDGNGAVFFTGAYGFTCTTLIFSINGSHQLMAGVTYTVTNFSNTLSTNSTRATLTSSSATVKAILNVLTGGTLALGYLNATRIDSSGGRTVFDFQGTLTSCLNWLVFSSPNTTLSTFVEP